MKPRLLFYPFVVTPLRPSAKFLADGHERMLVSPMALRTSHASRDPILTASNLLCGIFIYPSIYAERMRGSLRHNTHTNRLSTTNNMSTSTSDKKEHQGIGQKLKEKLHIGQHNKGKEEKHKEVKTTKTADGKAIKETTEIKNDRSTSSPTHVEKKIEVKDTDHHPAHGTETTLKTEDRLADGEKFKNTSQYSQPSSLSPTFNSGTNLSSGQYGSPTVMNNSWTGKDYNNLNIHEGLKSFSYEELQRAGAVPFQTPIVSTSVLSGGEYASKTSM
ncbi:hypothetical protein PROFUN_07253 [Planoprotostelium fungivorum]|uniref:Uncharacterized protein n=1 Tax=Planoprotostelium fungivorum TaxID=1890364 RepID=A0A2P6NMB0_9EUKA|nr:hypothetical protein PROFUN_07253 [Planoprotostelium fungivorum]